MTWTVLIIAALVVVIAGLLMVGIMAGIGDNLGSDVHEQARRDRLDDSDWWNDV
jgi:hypothetical protein